MVREIVRHNYLSLAGFFKTPSAGIHILNGHYISRKDVDQNVFDELLKKLKKDLTFVRIEEAAELLSKKIVTKQKLIAFTFDDGFIECYTKISPVLEVHNTNAAFFINPGFVEGDSNYIQLFQKEKVLTEGKLPMDWSQIIELHKRGHLIGGHTVDHIRLNLEDENEIEYQVKECKSIIEKKLGTSCEYFAYPYGQLSDISQKALNIVKDNYKYIFSGANYKNYYSFEGKIINRRHFEGDWPASHLNYFLSKERRYD